MNTVLRSLVCFLFTINSVSAFAQRPGTSGGYSRPEPPKAAPAAAPAPTLDRTSGGYKRPDAPAQAPSTVPQGAGDREMARDNAARALQQQRDQQAAKEAQAAKEQRNRELAARQQQQQAQQRGGTAPGQVTTSTGGVGAGFAASRGGAVDRSRASDGDDNDDNYRRRREQEDDEHERQRAAQRRLAEQRRLADELAQQRRQQRRVILAAAMTTAGYAVGRCVAQRVIRTMGTAENYRRNWYRGFNEAIGIVQANELKISALPEDEKIDTRSQAYMRGQQDGKNSGTNQGRNMGTSAGQAAGRNLVETRIESAFNSGSSVNLSSFDEPKIQIPSFQSPQAPQKTIAIRASGKQDEIYLDVNLARLRNDADLSQNQFSTLLSRSDSSTDRIVDRYAGNVSTAFEMWQTRNMGCLNHLQEYHDVEYEDYDLRDNMKSSFAQAYRSTIMSGDSTGDRYSRGNPSMSDLIDEENPTAFKNGFAVGSRIQQEIVADRNYYAGAAQTYVSAAEEAYKLAYQTAYTSAASASTQQLQNSAVISDLKARLTSSDDGSKPDKNTDGSESFVIGGPLTVVIESISNRGLKTEVPFIISVADTDIRATRMIQVPALKKNHTEAIVVSRIAAIPTYLKSETPYQLMVSVGGRQINAPLQLTIDWETQVKAITLTNHAVPNDPDMVIRAYAAQMNPNQKSALKKYILRNLQEEFQAVLEHDSGKYELKDNGVAETLLKKLVDLYKTLPPEDHAGLKALKAEMIQNLGDEPSRGFFGGIASLWGAENTGASAWKAAKALIDELK